MGGNKNVTTADCTNIPDLSFMNTMLTVLPLLFGLGTGEIILIVLVILLLFGGKKIPELMKGLGKGAKSFKEGMNEVQGEIDEIKKDINKTDKE